LEPGNIWINIRKSGSGGKKSGNMKALQKKRGKEVPALENSEEI